MKTFKLFVLAALLVAWFAFSAAAQDDAGATKPAKSSKDKKSDASSKKSADKSERQYQVGSRGGCYYLTESGKKNYVDKKYCEGLTAPASDSKPADTKPADSAPADKPEADSKKNQPAVKSETTGSESKTQTPADAANTSDPQPSDTTSSTKPTSPAADTTGKKNNDKDGRTYIKGSRGGCYYLTDTGKKVYVKDKSLCEN